MIFVELPTTKYNSTGETFDVEDELYLEYSDCYPEVDIIKELMKMRAWLISNDKRRKTKRGMKRFINSWLSRAQSSGNYEIGYMHPSASKTKEENKKRYLAGTK